MTGSFERQFSGVFDPRSIAVVGASNVLGKWGFIMPVNILGGGYKGELFMVNPGEKTVLGFPSYPSLSEIGRPVDLLIVTIPAAKVLSVLREAAAVGIKNAIVVSSNFSEVGEEGAELERELAAFASDAEISIIGPNTMGVYSASSSLCAVGGPASPIPGGVGFVSQSGNLGVQLLSWGKNRGLGFSRFVGSGNAANTDMQDYLLYLGEDSLTRVIALYVEGLRDGRRFLEVARTITPRKPIVVLKGGKGEQGGRAARSHSGALAAKNELFEAMLEQAGIVEAKNTEEFIDIVAAFDALPRAVGKKVAIITMGGGWGVVAADACDHEGLELASLPPRVVQELDAVLPSFWSRGNPVDLVGNLRRSSHFKVIDTLVTCDDIDILIVMGALLGKDFFIDAIVSGSIKPFFGVMLNHIARLPSFVFCQWKGFLESVTKRKGQDPLGSVGINPGEVWKWTDAALVNRLEKLVKEEHKPIITVAMDEREMTAAARLQSRGIFSAPTPERAVRAAAKIAAYGSYVGQIGGADERVSV